MVATNLSGRLVLDNGTLNRGLPRHCHAICTNAFKRVPLEEAEEYKPAPGTYNFLARKVGKRKKKIGKIWLVSENPVNIVGARAAGMQAVWVNREANGFGWANRLVKGEKKRPTAVVRDLTKIVRIIRGYIRT